MPSVLSQGARIAFETAGSGPPLLMLHALRASSAITWQIPGWVELLSQSRQLVLVDHRGHGLSDKPHDPRAYSREILANDALAVLDSLHVDRAAVLGYSMGTVVALELLLNHPKRFSAAILGGMGSRWARSGERRGSAGDGAMRAPPVPSLRTWLRIAGSYIRHYDRRAVQGGTARCLPRRTAR
jgi:pimeloyl-ACP methyl ester carboxylesterase